MFINKKRKIVCLFSSILMLGGCATHLNTSQNLPESTQQHPTSEPNWMLSKQLSRKLDAQYKIKNRSGFLKKEPNWMPSKVYNDGVSVYIIMPAQALKMSPVLYIYDENNNPAAVNYQRNKHYYRVDYLFNKALLVQGVGKEQEKVLIVYSGKPNS